MSNSTISKVAIYRNGCFITRQGTIDLKSGKNNVVLDTLPSNIDTNSFSLSLPRDLKGSNVQVLPLDDDQKQEILRDIQNEIILLDSKISTKEKQIEMWNKNADFSASTNISISEMAEYIEKLPERLEKIYKELQQLRIQRKKLNKTLEEKQNETNVYLVSADIETDKDGNYPYVVEYRDYRAHWNPLYEIRTSDNDELSILFKAKIYQETKEDFNDVELSLYTANPSLSGDIPVLSPTMLSCYEPEVRRQYEYMVETGAPYEMSADKQYGSANNLDMVMTKNTIGKASNEGTMIKYELENTWDIKNKNEIVLDIEEKKVPCKYHVIAVPKLDDNGFLAAEVDVNDIDQLLQSNATIYHNNAYVGEVYIDVDNNQQKYDISLGRDDNIKIKRELKKKYTSNVLLKNQKKIDFEYELKVTSGKDKKCLITLYDQIPVSQDRNITVDIDTTSNAKLDESTGKLTWNFELEPKENKTLDLKYSVSYPKDKKINL